MIVVVVQVDVLEIVVVVVDVVEVDLIDDHIRFDMYHRLDLDHRS